MKIYVDEQKRYEDTKATGELHVQDIFDQVC